VDTGGLIPGSAEPLTARVRRQAERAIDQADVVLFLVDARAGLTSQDEEIAGLLRGRRHAVRLVANKVDTPALAAHALEFHALGLGDPIEVSATHGLGIGELLDEVASALPAAEPRSPHAPPTQWPDALPEREAGAPEAGPVHVAVLGRPNVGKSSLVNALLGEERVVVDERPGTTRDAVDTPLLYEGRPVVLIDTAGLRRRSRVQEKVEFYSTRRTHEALHRADVAVLVVDATEGIADQDQRIARAVYEAGRGLVVAINKWDLLEGYAEDQVRRVARDRLRFTGPIPVCLTSAVQGRGIDDLMRAVFVAAAAWATRIPTGPLNRVIVRAVDAASPPANAAGRRLHIYYATQPGTRPPAFVLFVNDSRLLTADYRRYLERRVREAFDLTGTPIRWTLRGRRAQGPARTEGGADA
jgi:GTP-binding protein